MAANDEFFPGGKPTPEVLLAGRGYDIWKANRGVRSGGLRHGAMVVTVPRDAILLRMYEESRDFGMWWFTPYEYDRVARYMGVRGDILVEGRAAGRSALHGALALLTEWYGGTATDPGRRTQLKWLHVVRLREPVHALYGEGDVATTADHARQLKPIRLDGGSSARQLFLPRPWEYRQAFEDLPMSGTLTDRVLHHAARCYLTPLPFE